MEERLCNIFAGEILVPEDMLARDAESLGSPSLAKFEYLKRRYQVSTQVAAIRFTDLGIWDVAFVAWRLGPFRSPIGEIKEERIRVVWSAVARGKFIPNGDSVDNDASIIKACYETGVVATAQEKISLGSLRGTYIVECIRVPSSEGPYVLSMIHL